MQTGYLHKKMIEHSLALDSGFQLGSKSANLQRLRSLSLLDMLKAYAAGFYKIALSLQELRVNSRLLKGSGKISRPVQVDFEKFLISMKEECANLELKHTLNMALSIESKYRSKISENRPLYVDEYGHADLANDLDTLDTSFSNELSEELIFRLPSKRRDYFEKDDLFGPKVADAFPSSVDNVRNAGTCFAVEQWDACVFHLMRVLEGGLHVLAGKFNVPFQHATWNTVIEQIEAKVKGMNANFGADWREQKKFYSQAAVHFHFLKDAARNHIMHFVDVYDEGKAESVLTHVRELMQILAKGGLHE